MGTEKKEVKPLPKPRPSKPAEGDGISEALKKMRDKATGSRA